VNKEKPSEDLIIDGNIKTYLRKVGVKYLELTKGSVLGF
jgi:hypothetical protein